MTFWITDYLPWKACPIRTFSVVSWEGVIQGNQIEGDLVLYRTLISDNFYFTYLVLMIRMESLILMGVLLVLMWCEMVQRQASKLFSLMTILPSLQLPPLRIVTPTKTPLVLPSTIKSYQFISQFSIYSFPMQSTQRNSIGYSYSRCLQSYSRFDLFIWQMWFGRVMQICYLQLQVFVMNVGNVIVVRWVCFFLWIQVTSIFLGQIRQIRSLSLEGSSANAPLKLG